jgi:chitinase
MKFHTEKYSSDFCIIKKKTFFLKLLFFLLINKTSFSQTNDPVVLGYFPSWSENWASPGTNSTMREIPSHVNHVFLSFAKPNLTYVQGSYDISTTGIQVPYDGCTLKETVKVLSDKGVKVILSIGGETYWNSPDAYNIDYQQIKDLVDDMGFVGIDWDYEPNGSFSGIGTPTNVQHFIDFITFSRALMPKVDGYIIACAPSGVGALGGQTNDDPGAPFAFANRNTLTGETDVNLYNATVPTNGINMFGFTATGHMIPVFAAVGNDIDLVAYQGYNLGASTNRTLMYDAFAYYAEIHGFKIAAGVHYPDEPWGPYYTYTHNNVASLSAHIRNHPDRIGDGDGTMIWQLLMTGSGSSAYSYMHVSSDVLNGYTEANAVANANNFTMEPYSGGSEVSCFCTAPDPSLGADQSICGLPSINLNSGVAVQAGVTFTWKLDGTTIVSSSSTQNTYTITQAGTYTIEVEEGGCANTDVIVISDNLPSFNLGVDVNICPSGNADLNTGFTDSSYSYVWTENTIVLPGETSSSYTAITAGTYEVTVSATGCTSASDNVVVTDNLPAFDLGGAVNLCSPTTTVLNTGFTDPSFSYAWTVDGVIIPVATGSSYTATEAGLYEVTVSTTGCSSGSDNVTITSSLPLVLNDTICAAGTVNLTASESVEWYDAATGGTLLNTGITYSPNITANTDYWVTAGGTTQSYTTMRTTFQGGGWQQDPNIYGTKFIIGQNLTLDEVTVDAGGGSVTINVVGSDGVTVEATSTFASVTGLTPLTLGFALTSGTYCLNTVGSTSNVYVDLTPAANYDNPGVMLAEGEAYWDWGAPSGANYVASGDYGTFINLKYTVGSACDRVLVSGIIDASNPACGGDPCLGLTSTSTNIATACDSYTWNGTTYTTSGAYTWTGTNASGCDSVATLNLTINPVYNETDTISICNGDSYTFGTQTLTTAGTYTEVFTASNGCDSTVTLTLNTLTSYNETATASICTGDSYIFGTQTLTTAGVYTDLFSSVSGCDSTVVLTLNVNNATTSTNNATACDSYTWNGTTYTTSGAYTWTGTNASGCDSVATLNLTINPVYNETDTISICNGDTYIFGTQTLTADGTYTELFTSVNGCDSTIVLTLNIDVIDVSVTQSGETLTTNLNGATYQWLDCPGMTMISGATNQSYTATANGDYAVIVTSNTCSDSSGCYSVTGLGIIENDFGSSVQLYPNPTNGSFSISLGESYDNITITVADLRGRIIQSKKYNESQLLNLKIDVPTGVYLLFLESRDKKAVIKLIKE